MSNGKLLGFKDLMKAKAEREAQDRVVNSELTSATNLAPLTPVTTHTPLPPDIIKNESPVSPERNFQKVPNSVIKEAIPNGLFKSGKNKQLYDVLYGLTRGAIIPSRTVQISKPKLSKLAGISAEATLNSNLAHLQIVGLIRITTDDSGKHGGNIYEVLTPEENTPPTPVRGITPVREVIPLNGGQGGQDLTPVIPLETNPPNPGLASINIEAKSNAKTFFKTKEEKRIDDEPTAAFRSFNEKINEVFKQLMGREAKQSDSEALAAIGELLAVEILEAAGRTKVVSDVAKFSLTHLRRRLGVRTIKVETSSDKETGKGTASTKPTKREIQLSDDEIQECPDCNGRLLIYPGGPGKGAVMCKHEQLTKAKQAENQKGNQENKREDK
jgi:hypothetical protein